MLRGRGKERGTAREGLGTRKTGKREKGEGPRVKLLRIITVALIEELLERLDDAMLNQFGPVAGRLPAEHRLRSRAIEDSLSGSAFPVAIGGDAPLGMAQP